MKDFFTVLKFELISFLKNKTFIISTLIVCFAVAIGLSIPTIKNTFSTLSGKDTIAQSEKDIKKYGVIDQNNIIPNITDLETSVVDSTLIEFNNIKDLETQINEGELDAGYIIKSPTSYEYIIKNNEISGGNLHGFEAILIKEFRIQRFNDMGIDYSQVENLMNPNIEIETKVLGKDSASNYMYTYILVMILYLMITLYSQMIASAIASEKSNRTMEVLITSTKSTNLIFGKVLGVALAGVIQVALVISTGLMTYKINAEAWDNRLDFVFKIPSDVLISFAAFGILGYLLYAFMFGALGALVSRTEDVSASSMPIVILSISVFIISMTGMMDTSGLLLKVASFVPFSSSMSMFVRVSMGSVSNLEVMISLIILALSTWFIGLLASKIYRAGTLMYGNRVKLKDILKILKSE